MPIYIASDHGRPNAYLAIGPEGRWDCYGEHRLFAVFQEILLRRGVSLVHACGFDWNGHGVVLCGRGSVGKTSVALTTYSEPRLRLLGDDIVLMHESGELLGFPAPLSVYVYHHALFPPAVRAHLRAAKTRNRVLGPLEAFPVTRPLGRGLRRWLVARGGRIGFAAAKVRANFQRIHLREVLRADQRIDRTRVELALYLSRSGDEWLVDHLQPDAARSLYLATTYHELGLDLPLKHYSLSGAIDLPRHWRRASEVSERFLGSARQLLKIAVPSAAHPHEVQAFVLETIKERLGDERAGQFTR